jgi:hypothetical protein
MTGHRMATHLSNSNNISVTLVPDSAVYALMSKVHKVTSPLSSLPLFPSCDTPSAGSLLPAGPHGGRRSHLLRWSSHGDLSR